MSRVCHHTPENIDTLRQSRTLIRERDIVADTTPYYISVTFWVVNDLVTDDDVLYQLTVLNNAYNGKLVPPTEFTSVAGNFNITFELSYIKRVTTTEEWADLTDMSTFVSQNNTATELNVYINDFSTPNLLGQASAASDTYNNSCTIRYDTINTGVFDGMTLAHEVGHVCGLFHPFDYGCTGTPFDDITPTFKPNYFAIPSNAYNNNNLDNGATEAGFLEHWSQSAWDSLEFPMSCGGDVEEQGVNIMDYALDNALLLFSQDQIAYGRSEFGIRARNINVRGSPSTTDASTDAVGDAIPTSSSSFDMNILMWAGIGLGALVILFIIYTQVNKKKK